MMSRCSALMVVVASCVASYASAQVVICRVSSNKDDIVTKFQTMDVTEAEYVNYLDDEIMDGPCADWLGELCDDDDFCTIDYNDESHVCLEFPREVVEDCVSPFEA